MKDHPILMSSEMIRAILDGRKSQTRRVIKRQEIIKLINGDIIWYDLGATHPVLPEECPYGVVGDRLWVKEGWRCTGGGDLRNIIYRVDGDSAMSYCGIDDGRAGILNVPELHWADWDRLVYKTNRSCNWRPSIFMYKWAARLWLEITNIRVERVQEIDAVEAEAEGIRRPKRLCPDRHDEYILERFIRLWDSLNATRGFSWAENPFVWVIDFKRIEANQ